MFWWASTPTDKFWNICLYFVADMIDRLKEHMLCYIVRRLLPIVILLMMYLHLLYPYVDRLLTLLLFVLSLIRRG